MNFGKEILTFNVEITGADEVKGTAGEVVMIHFVGDCDCELFKGKILPGGVDTQKQYKGEMRSLSARYVLEGIDAKGEACKLFVENNASIGPKGEMEYTVPKILTDSKELAFLETADLKGTISPAEKGVTIHIFCAE